MIRLPFASLPCLRTARRPGAFTLIELLVTISIIAVLIGILVPAFSAVTSNAKKTVAMARIQNLERGLESFRNEPALGQTYPPSHSDNPDGALGVITVANPFLEVVNRAMTGANLLVYALVGADRLGTPGFSDTAADTDSDWWNNQDSTLDGGGLYEVDLTTREPLFPRYPSVGGSYVDETTRTSIKSFRELEDEGLMTVPDGFVDGSALQPVFTDPWGRPYLYYRANRAGRRMITDPGVSVGVYDNRDNGFLTGSSLLPFKGADFGHGMVANTGFYSAMATTNVPPADPMLDETTGVHDILVNDMSYSNTMERFILNPAVKQRNEPVNRSSFLLISAGEDAVYGTTDDIVNWTRE